MKVALVALVLVAGALAQTDVPTTNTPSPGLPYGAFCNGFLLKCNRFSETVACMQRRVETTSTAPLMTALLGGAPRQDICETGLGVDLGRCQCQRNCKQGVYVEDGMFDEEREICVGLVGSACSLLVPNCVKNGHCALAQSKCICDDGFVEAEDRTCVAAA